MLNLLRAELLRLISNRKMAVLGAFVLGLGFWISASMAVTLKPYTALEWEEAQRQSNDAQINLEVICGSSSSSSDCTALPTNITVEGFLRPQMGFEQFVVASLELTMQMGLLIVVVLITVMVGAEFSTGAIGTQLTFTPRRLPLLWAKALASAICGVCLMAIWAAAMVLLGVFFYLNVRGIEGLTASSLLDLLSLTPISYRWRLPERDELARLIDAAGILVRRRVHQRRRRQQLLHEFQLRHLHRGVGRRSGRIQCHRELGHGNHSVGIRKGQGV